MPIILKRAARLPALVLLAALCMTPADAATNLVTNGNFTNFNIAGVPTTVTKSFQFGTYGPFTPPQSLTGWSSPNGYNYVFLPTSTVATGVYGGLSLWSPASSTPSANGFTNASPTGGNFIAADGAYGTAPITQTITGLTVGHTYSLSFAWAGAQQSGFSGITTENWGVTFAGVTKTTATITVADHGFSGWMNQTFNFVATAATDTLSFLATGTPSGLPPFALLASVSMVDVPEPATMMVMLAGIGGLLLTRRRRGAIQAAA